MPQRNNIFSLLRRIFKGKAPAPGDAVPAPVALHRLLYLLLPALEAQGIALSPDRYIRLQRILTALPPDTPLPVWRNLLCPVLASDEEQQRIFFELFRQFEAQVNLEAEQAESAGQAPPEVKKKPLGETPAPPPSREAPDRPGASGLPRSSAPPPATRPPLVVELDECTEPPFSWNIVPDSEGIPLEAGPQFGRTLLQLRRRESAEHLLPDLPASIRATIAGGGVPTFRYRNPSRPTEYLLLVERYAMDDHRAGLFDHFYHTLHRNEIIIERFFYQGDLRLCRNERYPAGLSLQQLRYRYPDARLVVMGAGYRFLSPKTGDLADWTRPIFGWRRRVLLSPVSRHDWGARERALQRLFHLLPASLQSLHYLSDAADEALHGGYDALPEYVRRIAEQEPVNIGEPLLRSLRHHFDPGAMCWIAACAVYPALHFELTLRLGRLVSDSLGYNLLSAANLLALARLPWFTEGRMPPEARTELLEFLEHRHPEQHRLVLDYLYGLMERNPPPENSMARAEHQINLALLEAARNPNPDPETLAQLRAVVKRLDRPQKRGDFVLPRHWEAMLDKIGFAAEAPPPPEPPPVQPPPEFEGPLYKGMVFAGEYRLEQLIGRGGFGQVWQALRIEPGKEEAFAETIETEEAPGVAETGQVLAIKIFTGGERYYDYCLQEFKQTSRLEHPHIIHMYDCGMWNGLPWQTMPLYRPLAPAGEWEESELWRLLYQIAGALAYLHTHKPPITHNDIKPGQFLQDETGSYLLADFGISGELLEVAARDIRPTVNPEFLPPECSFDLFYRSPATDVFALGASLYYLAAGRPPYAGRRGSMSSQSASSPGPDPLSVQFSGDLNYLLMQCLSETPSERPDVERVREAAEAWLRERGMIADEGSSIPLLDMVLVKGGAFDMGDVMGDNEYDDETVHRVTLDDFYIGRYAVTFEEYDAFCMATGREKPGDAGWGRERRSAWHIAKDVEWMPFRGISPVTDVSWYDAVEYCNWLSEKNGLSKVYTISGEEITADWNANGYRLPTEAEWEYAARGGGKKVRFGNGKNIADPMEINFDGSKDYKKPYSRVGEYRQKTVPVGSLKSPNALGLHDMSGNVYEWCWDWYGSYPSAPAVNPTGPASGSNRVIRGGSWYSNLQRVRVANRFSVTPGIRDDDLGFRLARSVK